VVRAIVLALPVCSKTPENGIARKTGGKKPLRGDPTHRFASSLEPSFFDAEALELARAAGRNSSAILDNCNKSGEDVGVDAYM